MATVLPAILDHIIHEDLVKREDLVVTRDDPAVTNEDRAVSDKDRMTIDDDLVTEVLVLVTIAGWLCKAAIMTIDRWYRASSRRIGRRIEENCFELDEAERLKKREPLTRLPILMPPRLALICGSLISVEMLSPSSKTS